MRFAAPVRVRAFAAALAVGLFVPRSAAAQPAAAHPRHDDSTLNGMIIGGAIGTMGGFVTANVLDDRCGNQLCNRPTLYTYLLGVGVGGGSGIAVGWLIDKLHKGKTPVAVAVRADREAQAVQVSWRVGRRRHASRPTPPSDAAIEAPDAPRPPVPADGNWRPGATLPPRTPERNLFAAPAPVAHDSVADGAFYGAMAGAGAMVAPSLLSRSRTPLVIGGVAGAALGSVIDAMHVTPGRRPAVVVLADRDARALQLQWRF